VIFIGGVVGFVIFEFDLVVDLAGVGGVEDGDGAAAFFGGVLGFAHGVDKLTEGFEAGVGEFVGVGGHGGLLGRGESAECGVLSAEVEKKLVLYPGAEIPICARKAVHVGGKNARKCLSELVEKNLGIPWEGV